MLSADSEHPTLINHEIIFEVFQHTWPRYFNVKDGRTDRQTDRQTTCRGNTALSVASRGKNTAWHNQKYTWRARQWKQFCLLHHQSSSSSSLSNACHRRFSFCDRAPAILFRSLRVAVLKPGQRWTLRLNLSVEQTKDILVSTVRMPSWLTGSPSPMQIWRLIHTSDKYC